MGMLDRYKKKGGFIQLLTLIETSGKQKQDQFLNLIAQENKAWEQGIRKHMFSLERILGWQSQFLAEIFSRIQPLTLSTVLHGMPPEKLEAILGCLSIGDKRKIMSAVSERNPTPAEKATCVMKIISEVRGYCLGGVIKLDKADPEIAIPENIEELLNHQDLGAPATNHEELVFPDAEGSKAPLNFDGKPEAHRHVSDEVDFLKKKVNQLVQENNTLKHDLNLVRSKLDQIKKIA
jgi:hypothetical protein